MAKLPRPNRANRAAQPKRKAAGPLAVDPAQRRRPAHRARRQTKAQRAMWGSAGVALGGKHRREKRQFHPRPPGPMQISHIMGGTGERTQPGRRPWWAAAAAQMQPRVQSRRQPPIPRHRQGQAPGAAGLGDGAGIGGITQHHATKTARQAAYHRKRIGQADGIGEEP